MTNRHRLDPDPFAPCERATTTAAAAAGRGPGSSASTGHRSPSTWSTRAQLDDGDDVRCRPAGRAGSRRYPSGVGGDPLDDPAGHVRRGSVDLPPQGAPITRTMGRCGRGRAVTDDTGRTNGDTATDHRQAHPRTRGDFLFRSGIRVTACYSKRHGYTRGHTVTPTSWSTRASPKTRGAYRFPAA